MTLIREDHLRQQTGSSRSSVKIAPEYVDGDYMNFVDTYSLFLHSMKEIATKMSYIACL